MNLTHADIAAHWASLLPPASIQTAADCAGAVRRIGLAYPFPPDATRPFLPSLFPALATDDLHQQWDWMWGWKEQLAADRSLYYGKLVGAKPTFVALDHLPLLYALTGQTGDLWDDLQTLSTEIRVPELAKQVLRYLEEHGPTGTRTLIQKVTDGSKEMKSALEKALQFLDAHLLIAKVGSEGGNSFANTWDLFGRPWAAAVEAGTAIPTREAAVRVLQLIFDLTPALQQRHLAKLFPWSAPIERAAAKLEAEGWLRPCTLDGKPALTRLHAL
jgi:hypothetical protein